ncbi:hypothetical protein G6M24_41635 [Agrobacterium tumefaciens]|nr:hypothetical protein [Agrobacterium tumefaciens]
MEICTRYFRPAIRHQIQALIFVFFHQVKEKSPSAADLYQFFIGSRGKPARLKNSLYLHLSSERKRAMKNKTYSETSSFRPQWRNL